MRARSSRSCPPRSACSTRRAATSSSAPPISTPSRAGKASRSRRTTPALPSGFFPGNTGQIFDSDWSYSGAYKADLNDRFSYLLAFDQPFAGHTTLRSGKLSVSGLSGDLCRHGDLAGHRGALLRRDPERQDLWRRESAAVRCLGGRVLRQLFPRIRRGMGLGLSRRRRLRTARDRPAGGADLLLGYLLRPVDRRDDRAAGGGPHHREHDHGRRDAAVGPARLPDRRRSEDPRLRLCPLGRLVRVRRHPAAVRSGDRGRLRPVAADRELRGGHLDLQPRHRAPAHRQARRLVRRSPTSRRPATRCRPSRPTTARSRGLWG